VFSLECLESDDLDESPILKRREREREESWRMTWQASTTFRVADERKVQRFSNENSFPRK
jgi:hypothetical protein